MAYKLVLLWLAALPLMGSPGPATMSLTAMGTAFGVRAGLPYLAGIMAGTFGVLLLIATGVTGLILTVPALVWVITAIGVAYILYLAYLIATAPPLAAAGENGRKPAFSGGLILAITNPKAFAAIGAVYSSHTIVPGDLVLDAAVKITALLTVIVVVNTAWLAFGSALSTVLRDARTGRIANVIFAIMLVISVAMALLAA